MSGKVVPIRQGKAPLPSLTELVEKVRALAVDTANLHWDSPYVQLRMGQRGLPMRLVLETIRKGEGVSGPTLDPWGDWRIKLKKTVAGRRVQVVVAVKATHLVIVTVI
jgi:Domain of unknown function (DUF4258)